MRRRNPFLSACGSILLLCFCSYSMASCNGNGGSADSGGGVYVPAPSSASGSGQAAGSDRTVSADDLWTLSNEGNTGAIISRFSGPNASTATTTVSFSSSDLGLPAGGVVTLTITGRGLAYTADATDSGSGTVSFTIPQIASGTEITVSIIVKQADGTVVYAGSKTQTVTGSANDIHVSLAGEGPWTLPASLAVSASPSSITYDAGLYAASGSQTVTFSVAGLSAPPSGTLTYEWSLPTGTPLGSGDSITLDLQDDLLGGAPSAGGLYSCGVVVTATYTDDEGSVTTSSGTGVVAVTVLELPSFTMEVTPPAGVAVNSSSMAAYPYFLGPGDFTKQFAFTAVPTAGTGYPAGEFPEDTVFTWNNGVGVISGEDGDSFQASLSDWGLSTWAGVPGGAASYTMNCTAANSKAISPSSVSAPAGIFALKQYKLPKPTLTYSCSAGTPREGAVSGIPASYYAVSGVMNATKFDFQLSNAADMPAGTTWILNAGSSTIGSAVSLTGSKSVGFGQLTGYTDFNSSGFTASYSITITAQNPDYESSDPSDSLTIHVYKPLPASIGSFTTNLSCSGAPTSSVLLSGYKVGIYDSFGGHVNAADGVTLPDAGSGARYEWYICVNSADPASPPVLTNNVSTGFSGYTVKNYVDLNSLPTYIDTTSSGVPCFLRCKISFPGTTLESYADSTTIYLFKN